MTPNTPMIELPVDIADTFAPTMPDNWPAVLESRAAAAYLRDTKGTVDLLRATAVYLRQQALRAPAGEVTRPTYAQIIDIVEDCRVRRDKAGESSRMMARWVSEGLNALYASPPSEGVKVTDEMVETALKAQREYHSSREFSYAPDGMRAALEAALSSGRTP